MKLTLKIFLFIVLTILTQIGGIVMLLALWVSRFIDYKITARWQQLALRVIAFAGLYLFVTFILVSPVAQMLGRVRMPITEHNHVKPVNMLTCLLNRNYVRPELRETVYAVAAKMHERDTTFVLCYLDANFPFIDRFPLIPHLSHNDGKKIDIAFVYRNKDGALTNSSPSFIGYGISEEAAAGELNKTEFCEEAGYLQYGLLNKLVPQGGKDKFVFDGALTADIVKLFATDNRIGKIFIEPHLKQRLGLQQLDKIRFQGCHSVRHDDHIHVQLR